MGIYGVNRCLLGLPLLLATSPLAAGIITLDFENLAIVDAQTNHTVGGVFVEDGMQLTALHFVNIPDFNYPGILSPDFVGSTTLFHHISQGEILLTKQGGGEFDMVSIDLDELPSRGFQGEPIDFGSFEVTFIGTKSDGSVVSTSFIVESFPDFDTFSFDGFTDLASVQWFQGAGGGPGLQTHQFDNIVVHVADNSPEPIPEPATIMLLSLGTVIVACAQRRVRRR